MNNKGFTLIELLGVILLLSLLLVVSVPTIQNIIEGSKQKSLELIISNVETALETYVSEYGCNHNEVACSWTDNKCTCITIDDLITKGTLQANSIDDEGKVIKKIMNPITNAEMSFTLEVERTPIPEENSVYKYKYIANSD